LQVILIGMAHIVLVGRKVVLKKVFVFLIAFPLPGIWFTDQVLVTVFTAALLMTEHYQGGMMTASWIAAGCLYLGLLLERWLFFVEARHVVRLYYGTD
ncbi:MAG: hypothetical protein HKN85_10710, partial [Gammaproteobacteria bacterium]|nr:hypothetical protein [Gammaproteobacteria bacterium]